MEKEIFKKVMDVTGVEITPGDPGACLGNGEQGFECCCDACDYYLLCFPEFGRELAFLFPSVENTAEGVDRGEKM